MNRRILLIFFRECVAGLVLGKLLCKGSRLVQLTGLQSIEVFVCFQLALCNLQHFHSYIGAVICGTLAGGQR